MKLTETKLRQIIKEEIQKLNEVHMIKIDNPKQITSSKVKNQIKTLATKGVRAKDIRLSMTFVSDDMQSINNKFKVLKNKVYFELD
jgi:hypothetical protein